MSKVDYKLRSYNLYLYLYEFFCFMVRIHNVKCLIMLVQLMFDEFIIW